MSRGVLVLWFALLTVAPAFAQGQVPASSFRLTTGPCVERSGSGTPEGAVLGNVCDRYVRSDTGQVYYKISGTGNTGWITWTTTATNGALVVRDGAGGFAMGSLSAAAGTFSSTVTANAIISGAISGTTGLFTGALESDTTITADTWVWAKTILYADTRVETPRIEALASLTLKPAGDLIVDPTGNDIFPVLNYDINIGSPALKFLSLSVAELFVETLVAQDVLATIGGRIVVAPTTLLTADLAAGGTTLTVKHNNLANGDRVYMQDAPGGVPQVEFMAITSAAGGGAGAYTYTVTRNLDGTGANQWYAGDAVLNTGQTGNGFLDIYSTRGVRAATEIGPTLVGNVRNSATYNDWTPRFAVGNLNGLYDYATNIYGAAFGVPTAAWIKIDPTNGIRIGHNTTTSTQIDAAGNASFTGTVTADDGLIGGFTIIPNYLYSGIGAAQAGIASNGVTAFWAGSGNELTAPYRVTSGGALTATNATITGAITATSGSFTGAVTATSGSFTGSITSEAGFIGGFTIIPGWIYDSAGASAVGIGSAGTWAFYAGDNDPASAPFRVTSQGNFTSVSGVIGAWSISSAGIYVDTGTDATSAGMIPASWAFYAGRQSGSASTAPFRVNRDGSLVATSATITGAITATSGSFTGAVTATSGAIGGCTLNSTTLTCGSTTLTSSGIAAGSGSIGGCTLSSTTLDCGGNILSGSGITGGTIGVDFVDAIYNITVGALLYVYPLGGSGNRTVCVNNVGLFYTVASGAAC